jgi:hypothetical protein
VTLTRHYFCGALCVKDRRYAEKKAQVILAVRRAAVARQIVADQHELILKLKASGHSTLDAENALLTYVSKAP